MVTFDDDDFGDFSTNDDTSKEMKMRQRNIPSMMMHLMMMTLATLVLITIRAREMKMRQGKILRMMMHLMMMTLAILVPIIISLMRTNGENLKMIKWGRQEALLRNQ